MANFKLSQAPLGLTIIPRTWSPTKKNRILLADVLVCKKISTLICQAGNTVLVSTVIRQAAVPVSTVIGQAGNTVPATVVGKNIGKVMIH